jgi:hypothetical protein
VLPLEFSGSAMTAACWWLLGGGAGAMGVTLNRTRSSNDSKPERRLNFLLYDAAGLRWRGLLAPNRRSKMSRNDLCIETTFLKTRPANAGRGNFGCDPPLAA